MEAKNGKPSELAEAMMQYLDCECRYFPPMRDDTELCAAYRDARRDATDGGYVPMLIKVDEVLFECLIMNSDPDSDGEDDYRFDAAAVAAYRREQLSRELPDGREILKGYLSDRREEAEDDELDWDRELVGAVEGGEEIDCFAAYRDYRSKETAPVILAKIPVKHAFEVFAYLPFGNWNDCPDTPQLMAAAKYWFEQHGAVPAAMSHDELEFLLPTPVPKEKAVDSAVELYSFCPDVIDQGPEDATVGALADVLQQSTVWYLWWD